MHEYITNLYYYINHSYYLAPACCSMTTKETETCIINHLENQCLYKKVDLSVSNKTSYLGKYIIYYII